MGALNSDMLCAGPPAGESPLVPLVSGLLTATETDAAMPTNLRGDNLVMQQLPPTARFISAHFHWRKSVPHPVTEYQWGFKRSSRERRLTGSSVPGS